MKKRFLIVGAPLMAAFAFIVSAMGVKADVPTATSTLSTIMGVIISTTVSLATTIFTTYWPYILVIGVIIGLIAWFKRLVHSGHK
jgi:hypothetical protein